MEQGLYFQPEHYKEPKSKHKEIKEKNYRPIRILICILIMATIVIIIIWIMRGKTTVSGQFPANVRKESLECVSTELTYDKLGSISPAPDETNLTITAIFIGEDSMRSLSIKNLMTFKSNSDAFVAEARAHATFNFGLQALGYDAGQFDNKFSIIDTKLLVNLSTNNNELNEYVKDYFLIKSDNLPVSLSDFQTEYESQNFQCTSTIGK